MAVKGLKKHVEHGKKTAMSTKSQQTELPWINTRLKLIKKNKYLFKAVVMSRLLLVSSWVITLNSEEIPNYILVHRFFRKK